MAAMATCRHGDSTTATSEHVVRVNGVESGLLNLDLAGVFQPKSRDSYSESHDVHTESPDAIMLPKVDCIEHITEVESATKLSLFVIIVLPL